MRIISVILALSLSLGWPEDRHITAVGHFAEGVVKAFAGLVAIGDAAWAPLANKQSERVLEELASKAATLESKKNDLKTELEENVKNKTTDQVRLSQRIQDLKMQVVAIRDKMDKFSVEIDKAAKPVGDQVRIETNKAEIRKINELNRVESRWVWEKQYQKAIDELDAAVKNLDKMRAGIACLQNSIARQAAACNPKTLEPIAEK